MGGIVIGRRFRLFLLIFSIVVLLVFFYEGCGRLGVVILIVLVVW